VAQIEKEFAELQQRLTTHKEQLIRHISNYAASNISRHGIHIVFDGKNANSTTVCRSGRVQVKS